MTTRKDIHNSDIPKLCQACEARHRGICGALEPDQLSELAKHTRQVKHESGSELVADSEEVTSYANVMQGVVKLTKMLSDGRQQVIGLQFAPDFLGRPFATQSKMCAEAASDVNLCKIPRRALETMMKKHPELEHRLLMQILKELDSAREWMVTLGRKTAAEKVASFLYLIATNIDPTIDVEEMSSANFELPLTRIDIADFLGLTVETVSRQLTKLRKDDVIQIEHNRTFVVPSMERLELRCG
ncbi:Crp/Fnr family transcriptional regulator [Maritalea sp.]|uniref:Crp/Fnr family transcriptional regulator n=1 Tax=Maritalea sp. TaxID=2003361 RepID=UPI003EF853CD